MRYYAIRVDIFEAAIGDETPASLSPASRVRSASRTRSLGYAYPVVRHQFLGKQRACPRQRAEAPGEAGGRERGVSPAREAGVVRGKR